MITIEEVETFDYAAGTVLEQTPAPGEQYSLNSKTKIVLKVAKETTSIEMPNYVGSTYDFANENGLLSAFCEKSRRRWTG